MEAVTSLHLPNKQAAIDDACDMLRVLCNRDRLNLLCHIAQGEFSVGQLEEMTGITQPTLSQQLTVLRKNDMVKTRREGKQIYYQIASHEALRLMQVLQELFACADEA